MMQSQPPKPFISGQPSQAAPAAPAPPMLQISPQISDALAKIAQGLSQSQGGGVPIDRNSPEYKQAMMQQLASSGPMGAAGALMQGLGDSYRQKKDQQQADLNAWMPVVTRGE